jgi:hypothetical protein
MLLHRISPFLMELLIFGVGAIFGWGVASGGALPLASIS